MILSTTACSGKDLHRKQGTEKGVVKAKKCTLPSDRLTNKQWKERCGPVVSFNFNKPIEWDHFKKLPAAVQTEYITNLQKRFGATAVDLGNMFGVRALTVRKHADANDLGVDFPRGHAMSASKKYEWARFLGCEENEADSSNTEQVEVEPAVEDSVIIEESKDEAEEKASSNVDSSSQNMSMKRLNIHFSGTINVDMIANSLKLILGNSSEGDIEIVCNLS